MYRCHKKHLYPKNPNRVNVTPDHCHTHLYLLEHFVSVQTRVAAWAKNIGMSPEKAWTLYVNLAAERTRQWHEETRRQDLQHAVPPLDVIMISHSITLSPKDYARFLDPIKPMSSHYGWSDIRDTLKSSKDGVFDITGVGKEVAETIFASPDLLQHLDACTVLLSSRHPGDTAERLLNMYMSGRQQDLFSQDNGSFVSIKLDIHAAVDAHLDFANRVLEFSWHRMYPALGTYGRQFDIAIQRYHRFSLMHETRKELRRSKAKGDDTRSFVPALDIDFVWRTHMLTSHYHLRYLYDADGLAAYTPSLPDGAYDKETANVYERLYYEKYNLCLCWCCVHSRAASPLLYKPCWLILRDDENTKHTLPGTNVVRRFTVRRCERCGSHPCRNCKHSVWSSLFRKGKSSRQAAPPEELAQCEKSPVSRRASKRTSISFDDMFHGQSPPPGHTQTDCSSSKSGLPPLQRQVAHSDERPAHETSEARPKHEAVKARAWWKPFSLGAPSGS
ncbi:hypothetical protein B0T10DRAFT_550650 [Thelonectria olida]|uniref:Uncharacterized protein n=1 Tax=Thelonectria olida TaxID=1576542 RepID=A0A9P8W078_9HYPO|nr:hypothetical protein B0T10DRAFT_550650 [Thelonectria olida]